MNRIRQGMYEAKLSHNVWARTAGEYERIRNALAPGLARSFMPYPIDSFAAQLVRGALYTHDLMVQWFSQNDTSKYHDIIVSKYMAREIEANVRGLVDHLYTSMSKGKSELFSAETRDLLNSLRSRYRTSAPTLKSVPLRVPACKVDHIYCDTEEERMSQLGRRRRLHNRNALRAYATQSVAWLHFRRTDVPWKLRLTMRSKIATCINIFDRITRYPRQDFMPLLLLATFRKYDTIIKRLELGDFHLVTQINPLDIQWERE